MTKYVAVIFDDGEHEIEADNISAAALQAMLIARGDDEAVLEVRRADYREKGNRT